MKRPEQRQLDRDHDPRDDSNHHEDSEGACQGLGQAKPDLVAALEADEWAPAIRTGRPTPSEAKTM
jgi:hypothetical protein